MQYKYLNDKNTYCEKQPIMLRLLYNNVFGRIVLKVITLKGVSKFIGIILDSRISSLKTKRYIRKNKIDMSEFEDKKYKSFNEFFTRKKKDNNYKSNKNDFISTANSKISCYNISNDLLIHVKNTTYSIEELVQDKEISKEYKDGLCIIYRLSPSDYHRYIFCDNGTQKFIKRINGRLHTVNPIVYDKYKVFSENSREITKLDTENFGRIIQIEVGALCVGKIVNNDIEKYNKYDEKGYFEFGGSTIIQLIKKDSLSLNDEIMQNTKNDIETFVKIGEIIGKKK